MAVADIVTYLAEQEDWAPIPFLLDELRNSGYPESEIRAALRARGETLEAEPAATPARPVPIAHWSRAGAFVSGLALSIILSSLIGLFIILLLVISAWIGAVVPYAVLLAGGAVLTLEWLLWYRWRRSYPSFSRGFLVPLALSTLWLGFPLVQIGFAGIITSLMRL